MTIGVFQFQRSCAVWDRPPRETPGTSVPGRRTIPMVRRPGTDVPGVSRGGLSQTAQERWNWNTPIVMSSFDPRTLYMGSNIVFRSPDRGATWNAISPDLTANIDRESLPMMGARVPER